MIVHVADLQLFDMAAQEQEQKVGLLIKGKKTPLPLKDVSVEVVIQGYMLGPPSMTTLTLWRSCFGSPLGSPMLSLD